jgi:hypothetical protein
MDVWCLLDLAASCHKTKLHMVWPAGGSTSASSFPEMFHALENRFLLLF